MLGLKKMSLAPAQMTKSGTARSSDEDESVVFCGDKPDRKEAT